MFVEIVGIGERVGKRQRHGRVVCPFAGLEPERAAADHVGEQGTGIALAELERRADCIPDREAEQGACGPVANGGLTGVRHRRGHRLNPQHMAGLRRGLDRPGTHPADLGNCLARLHAQFDQQPCGYRTGPAQAALAVDQHAKSLGKDTAQLLAGLLPGGLELGAGNRDIPDRQVIPGHVALAHGRPEVRNAQCVQFMVLDQADDGGGTPVANRVEIDGKVTRPCPAQRCLLLLARAEGNTDGSLIMGRKDFGDL